MLFLLLLQAASLVVVGSQPVVVLHHGGSLQGFSSLVNGTRINVFKGVPYAAPPVGPLRFADPQPHAGWPGHTLDASRDPNSCMQPPPEPFEYRFKALTMWHINSKTSEDCLFLNIWAPVIRSSAKKMPVLVWIHGGSFYLGSGSLSVYDGSYLAASQNVIVVSINYRLGLFGHFFIRQKARRDRATNGIHGNQGMKDQLAALRWIQKNIAQFNGDPAKVTLVGESAGAVSIGLHMLSPHAQGLFHGSILQSGSPLTRWAIETPMMAENLTLIAANSIKCNGQYQEEIIDCMRKKSAHDVVQAFNALYQAKNEQRHAVFGDYFGPNADTAQYFDIHVRAVVDGFFLPLSPQDLLKHSREARSAVVKTDGPVMMGTNSNEALFFVIFMAMQAWRDHEAMPEQFWGNAYTADDILATYLDYGHLDAKLIERVKSFYGLEKPSGRNRTVREVREHFLSVERLGSDIDFVCPQVEFADELATLKSQLPLYVYEFDYRSKHLPMPQWTGIMHGYEIEYVFGMPFSPSFRRDYYNFTPEEVEASKRIMSYWGNFAHYGKPTLNESIWKPYGPRRNYFLISNEKFSSNECWHGETCSIWLSKPHVCRAAFVHSTLLNFIVSSVIVYFAASSHVCC